MRNVSKKTRKVYEDVLVRLKTTGSNRLPGVIIEGVKYSSPTEAANAYGVSTQTISGWINGHVKEATNIYYPPFDNCKPVFINSKHEKAWRSRVANNIKNHREPPGHPPAVVIDGFIYSSTEEAAEEFGVTTKTIQNWCREDTITNCWYESNKVYKEIAA